MPAKRTKIVVGTEVTHPHFAVYDDGTIGTRGPYPKRGKVRIILLGEHTEKRDESVKVLTEHLADYYDIPVSTVKFF